MLNKYINELHKKYLSIIEDILERKLRMLGFTEEFNIYNIRRFIRDNHIELLIENKPMLTSCVAKDKITRNELFRFNVESRILKENNKYVLKTEFLQCLNVYRG